MGWGGRGGGCVCVCGGGGVGGGVRQRCGGGGGCVSCLERYCFVLMFVLTVMRSGQVLH